MRQSSPSGEPRLRGRGTAFDPRAARDQSRGLAAFVAVPLAALASLSAASAGVTQPPAPTFGLNAANTNASVYVGVETDPFIRWQIQHDRGSIYSPAIIVDGTGVLYSQRLVPRFTETGEPAGVNIPSASDSTPAIGPNGNIYQWVNGRMRAYAPGGAPLWQAPATNFTSGNGVKLGPDGTIYGGGGDGVLYAYSPQGQIRWTAPGYEITNLPPAIDAAGNVYVARGHNQGQGTCTSYDPDGNVRWSVPWNQAASPSPPILGPDGNLYVPEQYGTRMAVFDTTTGARIRTQPNTFGGVQAISPAGVLYSASYQSVTATDLLGNLIWQATVPPDVFMRDLVVDAAGKVYCTANNNRLFAFSPTGEHLWTFQLAASHPSSLAPVIGEDGTLFVQSGDVLTAIGGIVPAPGASAMAVLAMGFLLNRRRPRASAARSPGKASTASDPPAAGC